MRLAYPRAGEANGAIRARLPRELRAAARGLAALATGLLLLRLVAAAARAARLLALAAAAALAALGGGVRGVGDLRRALLAHALLLEPLVLLVVLDAGSVVLGHGCTSRGRVALRIPVVSWGKRASAAEQRGRDFLRTPGGVAVALAGGDDRALHQDVPLARNVLAVVQ